MTSTTDYREIERRHAAYRRRQQMDLSVDHALCESNYLRLLRILPEMATRDSRLLGLHGNSQQRQLQFSITDRSRYTTCIEIRELTASPLASHQITPQPITSQPLSSQPLTSQKPWGFNAEFHVRAYHDTRMVEVTAFQRQRQLPVRTHYPNPQMLLPDERQQWNALLAEWLSHCLQHGYCLETAV